MRIKATHFIKIFIVALLQISFAQGTWIKISQPTFKNLKAIYFIDSLKGWIAGDSGVILHTTDGGQNWSYQQSNVTTSIHDLFFLDSLNGWGLTWHQNVFGPVGTTFLKTTNGGQTWTTETYPKEFSFFYSILFNDSLNGWICGHPGSILKTRDGGQNWDEVKFYNVQFSQFPIFKIKFFNQNFGIGCGGVIDIFGVIWRTTDGGEFWDAFPIGPEPINDFQIISEDFVFAVGGDYEYGTAVSHSTDQGLTWNYRTLDIFGIANSVAFRNDKEGWLNLKGERKFLVTIDSGYTWNEYPLPDSVQPNKIVFVDSLCGFAICDSGYILKYVPKKQTKVTEENFWTNLFSEDFEWGISPNPFNSVTRLNFRIKKSQFIRIELYSILGQKLKTIEDEFLNAGEYSIQLNESHLNSGVYLIRFSTENKSETKKIILIK
jgi:photosystem II stability/assembly factor-like uncharacterized protein